MEKFWTIHVLASVCLLSALLSCGGGGGGEGGSVNSDPDPLPIDVETGADTTDPAAPLARAGGDQLAISGDAVTLIGSDSTDPQGGALQYAWTQTLGNAVTLSNASSAAATFTAPSVELGGATLVFKLTVTDRDAKTGYDLITVHVDPLPSLDPTVVFDTLETQKPGDMVVLSASHSVDPQGGDLIYAWSQLDGTSVVLEGSDSDTVNFIAPDTEGDLLFQLSVTTEDNRTAVEQVSVSIAYFSPTPPKTSTALIDEAIDSGAITPQKGMVYKVLALFNDSRLPGEFAGTLSNLKSGSTAIGDLAENFDSLSDEDKATVAPFLLPPYVTGSWDDLLQRNILHQRPQKSERTAGRIAAIPAPVVWKWVTNGKVKVWYKEGFQVTYGNGTRASLESLAEGLLDAVGGTIWSGLQDLMKREPLSDAGYKPNEADYNIKPGDFDASGKLDIILSSGMDCYAVAVPYKERPTPAFIIVDATKTPLGDEVTQGLVQTVAHELMHAWQCSYATHDPASTYSWLREATAVWTEDFIYPRANTENEYTKTFMDTMSMRLDNKYNDRHYGAYLPFSYWTHNQSRGGPPDIIRQIMEAVPAKSSLDALDSANPLPFAEYMPHFMSSFTERYWGDFLAAAWNRGADGYYRKKDNAEATPRPTATKVADMLGSTDRGFFLGALDPSAKIEIPYLSGRYYYFLFRDDAARTVIFFDGLRAKLEDQVISRQGDGDTNGYMGTPLDFADPMSDPAEGATWRVLVKVKGKWKDWTPVFANVYSPMLTFCRDSGDERIEEMVVALGNSSTTTSNFVTTAPGGLSPLVFVSNAGCWRWEGEISVKSTNPSGGPNATSTTHIVMENPTDIGLLARRIPGIFAVKSAKTSTNVDGATSWSHTSEDGLFSSQNCSYSGGGSFDWNDSRSGYEFKMIPNASGGALYRKAWFENGSGSVGTVDYTENCTNYWEAWKYDANGNKYKESYRSSESTLNTMTPDVWPPGLGDVKMAISGQGNRTLGSFTSSDGYTEYQWNLSSLRE
ncbi:MAG: hypothetical protein H8D34_31930 [Chloroflexi bacterium]|nr:hypothetical protein [Chloroflexota bacterium]